VKALGRVGLYAALTLAALTFIYPFLWMVSSTLKPPFEVGTLELIPDRITLDNYRTMWARAPFGRALLNSAFVATTITLAVLLLGSITAYAMARLRFRGAPILNAVTIAVLLIPGQLTLIPMYTLIVKLGWIDTYAALIVPYLFNATAVLMLRQFFLQIPQSLIDSARMDGMGEMRILFTVFWPLAKPVLAIVAIFTFMGSWNEVLWPLLVVREQQLMTLPQLLTVFALGGGAGSLGVSLASAMVLVVPVVIAYVFLQRYFIESMAGSGTKGSRPCCICELRTANRERHRIRAWDADAAAWKAKTARIRQQQREGSWNSSWVKSRSLLLKIPFADDVAVPKVFAVAVSVQFCRLDPRHPHLSRFSRCSSQFAACRSKSI
jgi:multiple sugar transport system permease protein